MVRARTSERLIVLALIAILCSPLILFSTVSNVEAASGDWTIRTVDRRDAVSNTLAIDQNDRIHIVFHDKTAGALGYARNNNPYGNWTFTWIDDNVIYFGAQASMAMDSNDRVHICYYDGFSKELRYAVDTGDGFSKQVIDNNTVFDSMGISIAVDAANKAHISYVKSDMLMYATNAGGSWNSTVLKSDDPVLYPTYIAIGSDDVVHIAYSSYHYYSANSTSVYRISHAWKAGLGWNFENIAGFDALVTVGIVHTYGALTVDSNNRPQFIYSLRDMSLPYNPRLMHVVRDASGWSTPYQFTSLFAVPQTTTMSLITDPSNEAHIAYYDHPMGLYYATSAGGWNVENIINASVGYSPSIGLDSNGKKYIAYNDPGASAGDFKLKYVTTAKVPTEPWGFTATPGPNMIDLQWSAPNSTGDYPLLGYCIDLYNVDPTGGYATPILSLAVPAANTSHALTGLYNVYGYWVVIRAASSAGLSDSSSYLYVVPGDTPTVPTYLSAMAISNNITVSWSQPTYSNGSALTSYALFWGLTTTTVTNEVVLGDVLSYVHHDLTPGQFYYYKVRATNGIGWGPFTQVVGAQALGDPPFAPSGLLATAGDGSVTLTWSASSTGLSRPLDSYYLFRGNSAGGIAAVAFATVPAGTLTFTDNSVTNGQTYYYVVAAKNAYGFSDPTHIASATPTGTAPPPDDGDGGDMTIIIIAVVALVAIIGVALVVMRMRR